MNFANKTLSIELTPNGLRALSAPATRRGASVPSRLACALREADFAAIRRISNRSSLTRVSPAVVNGQIYVSYGRQTLGVIKDVPGTWRGMGQGLAMDALEGKVQP